MVRWLDEDHWHISSRDTVSKLIQAPSGVAIREGSAEWEEWKRYERATSAGVSKIFPMSLEAYGLSGRGHFRPMQWPPGSKSNSDESFEATERVLSQASQR